jgi:hypothetical protein
MANKMHPLGAPRASYTWSASAREVDMATSVAKPVHLLIDANFLGYGCVMVEDCCATTSPDFCTEASCGTSRSASASSPIRGRS